MNPNRIKMRNGEWGMRNIPPTPSLPREGGRGGRNGIQDGRIKFRVEKFIVASTSQGFASLRISFFSF
jgi:hypothetical protein